MGYKNEWFLLEADDDIDEIEHREPTEEFLFYRAVATGDVETVKKNCEQGRFIEEEGVGILSRDPVVNLKYHFVITTAMITRLCRQNGMELEQAFRTCLYSAYIPFVLMPIFLLYPDCERNTFPCRFTKGIFCNSWFLFSGKSEECCK